MMGNPRDPIEPPALAFGSATEAVDRRIASAASSPTCRRLLAMMAALPAADRAAAPGANPSRARDRAAPDPTPRLFAKVQVHLAEHELALQTCDQLEAALAAALGYPRDRLPGADGLGGRFAADLETIAGHVLPGRRRERLQRVLQRRQVRWADAAQACGLIQA